MENHQVTFQWKDYQHGNRLSDMTLSADEFIRRFLLHALPKAFQRIRHYGFLANAHRQEKLELCRKLLWQDLTGLLPLLALVASLLPSAPPATADSLRCPVCRMGVIVTV